MLRLLFMDCLWSTACFKNFDEFLEKEKKFKFSKVGKQNEKVNKTDLCIFFRFSVNCLNQKLFHQVVKEQSEHSVLN